MLVTAVIFSRILQLIKGKKIMPVTAVILARIFQLLCTKKDAVSQGVVFGIPDNMDNIKHA